MDKKVINKDLDDLLDKRMVKIARKREAAARASLRSSEKSSSPLPGRTNSPNKLKTVLEANLEMSRSSIGRNSPLKILCKPK